MEARVQANIIYIFIYYVAFANIFFRVNELVGWDKS